jgi:hypothetical protein
LAGGHCMRWSPMRRTRLPGRLRTRFLSVYSLILAKVLRKTRPVQWSLLNGRRMGGKGTAFEGFF